MDASDEIEKVVKDRKIAFQRLKEIYEVSMYPKGRSVDGKEFVPFENRRSDLTFMTEREEALELDKYRERLDELIRDYAKANDLEDFAGLHSE